MHGITLKTYSVGRSFPFVYHNESGIQSVFSVTKHLIHGLIKYHVPDVVVCFTQQRSLNCAAVNLNTYCHPQPFGRGHEKL
jgi:hypothetical protein